MSSNICGCGKPIRYICPSGNGLKDSCNKYARCPTWDQLHEQNEQMRRQLNIAKNYCHELLGAWSWKKGERAGNAEQFEELLNFIVSLSPTECVVNELYSGVCNRGIKACIVEHQNIDAQSDNKRNEVIDTIKECTECGSKLLSWSTNPWKRNGVAEGRLRTSEIGCDFVLGCDECSETLRVVDADEIAAVLNASIQPTK